GSRLRFDPARKRAERKPNEGPVICSRADAAGRIRAAWRACCNPGGQPVVFRLVSRRKAGSPFSLGQKGPRGSGLFSCEVLDPLGTPLRGAEITVYDRIGNKWLMNATSDPFGHFTASLMP